MLKEILFGLAVFFLYITFNEKNMAKPTKATIRVLMGICILMIVTACSGSTAPKGPQYKVGPGCTIYTSSPVGPNGWSDITAVHYDVCPRVVMDSTLVTP